MKLRFWIGLAAVLAIAAGSVVAALVVHAGDSADFQAHQDEEAMRSAHQAESMARLSIDQLASAAAFFQAEGHFSEHEFDVVAAPLLRQGALSGTAYVQHLPNSARAAFERSHGAPIFEPGQNGPRREGTKPFYYPVVYAVSNYGPAAPVGYDLNADPERAPFLLRARDSGRPVATTPAKLLIGGVGVNVYWPVYRDRAPTRTVAERRAALVGFAAGAFRVHDLAAAAISAVPDAVDVQLRIDRSTVVGHRGALDDSAEAPIHIADRTWLLVVRDPNRPDSSLPLLLAVVGIALAALLAALILAWSRNEQMQKLQYEANSDSLTGLKNRRRFGEDLRTAMARIHREGATGAVLMLDLDHFKRVNDSQGHPAGDQLLVEIADVLRRRTREGDALARLGGDEFAVVLPRATPEEARAAAESIATAIREHRSNIAGVGPITVSVGIAMFGDDPRTSAELVVSEADTAMYSAKDGGRDGVRLFDPAAVRDGAAGAP